MKPRIRRFLAGLLSLGLLLQAASPLSALAADESSGTASGAAPTLTVTVNDQTYPIDSQTKSINIEYSNGQSTACTAEIKVDFSGSTYTLTGTFPVTATITGTGDPSLVVDGGDNAVSTATSFTVTGVHDFTATSTSTTATRTFDCLILTCSGDVEITSPTTCVSWLNVKNAHDVKLTSIDPQKNSNSALSKADIKCTGDVTLENQSANGPLSNQGLVIETPGLVSLRASYSGRMTQANSSSSYSSTVTSGGLIMSNTHSSGSFGEVDFTRYTGNDKTFVVRVGSSENDTVPQYGLTADNFKCQYIKASRYTTDNHQHYLSVLPEKYEEYGIALTSYGASVDVSNLNYDNIKFAQSSLKYDRDSKVLSAENQLKAYSEASCLTFTCNGDTKLMFKQGSANALELKNTAQIDIGGSVTRYLEVTNCTGDVTVNGSVSYYVDVKADGNVKIVGSNTNDLVSEIADYTSKFTAKSLLMENTGGGIIGKVKFTKLNPSNTYLVVTGKSGEPSTRKTETMSGDTYSITRNDDISYLYIYEVTPPAAETLTVRVNGVSQTINSYSTGIDNTNVKVKFNNTSKTYTLTGAFDDNAKVEIVGANTPNLVLDLTTGQLDSLNLVGLGDVHISSTAAGSVTASGLTASAKSLTVNNTVGNVGTVKFTSIGSGDYNVTTGTSETNTDEPEPLQNGAYNATVNKGYLSITSGKVYADPQLIVTVNGTRYELNPDSTTLPGATLNDRFEVSYQNGIYTITGHLDGDVTITGKAYKGTLPGLKWEGASRRGASYDVNGSLTVENVDDFQWNINYYGAKALKLENCGNVDITGYGFVTTGETVIDNAADVTLTTNAGNGNALGGNEGNVTINCTGAVTLTNETGALAGNTLTITTPGNVTLNANSRDTLNVVGSLNVTARKLIVDNTGSASVGTVTFNGATADYTAHVSKTYKEKTIDIPNGTPVKSRYLYVGPESEYVAVPSSDPTLTITVGDKDYTIDSETEKIEELGITVQYGNGEYTLTGGFNGLVSVTGTPCNGKKPSVSMKNENGAVVVGSLNVSDVEDFSAEGRGIVNGDLKVTASGKVELDAGSGSIVESGSQLTVKTTGSVSLTGSGSNSQLIPEEAEAAITAGKLTAQNPGGKIGTIVFTPSSGSGCLVNDKKTELDENGTITVSDADMADNDAQLVVEIDPSTIPSDSTSSGNSGSIGGAVAAVMVGGAAVWGGYEIATRVILHNLLPEGAEIPTTRGALALLVWNAAGRPEPANAPAFTDVADADMAKAAQWCVEQGLLDAKTETTFKPDGLVTKVKVIEVWNKAFPKN